MRILEDNKNSLLKRREIKFVMESVSNPGFENSKNVLAEKVKTEKENIAIKFIKNNYGTRDFVIEAFIYDSKQDREKIEPKVKEKKKVGGGN